jgi:hypothetical protein
MSRNPFSLESRGLAVYWRLHEARKIRRYTFSSFSSPSFLIFIYLFWSLIAPEWWETIFTSSNPGKFREPVVEKGSPVHESFFLVLARFLSKIGGNSDDVETAYAVDNAVLRFTLKNSLQLLEGKLADTKSLFKKEDWKTGPDSASKRQVLYHLGDYVSLFRRKDWNDGAKVFELFCCCLLLLLSRFSQSTFFLLFFFLSFCSLQWSRWFKNFQKILLG